VETTADWVQIVLLFVVWIYLARIYGELVRIRETKGKE